ncbi:hypothetical protein D3C72_1267370 [compost metagenome]
MVGGRMGNGEPTFGKGAVVARRHDQVLATLATIGSRQANIDNPTEPVVLDRAEYSRCRLQHHGALCQIERTHCVDRVGIGGQKK